MGWGFLVVCFIYKTNPNLYPNFSWVGLALAWELRRFYIHVNIFPSQLNLVNRKHLNIKRRRFILGNEKRHSQLTVPVLWRRADKGGKCVVVVKRRPGTARGRGYIS